MIIWFKKKNNKTISAYEFIQYEPQILAETEPQDNECNIYILGELGLNEQNLLWDGGST